MKNYKGLIKNIFLETKVNPDIPFAARNEIWKIELSWGRKAIEEYGHNEEYMKNIYQISLCPIIKKYDIRDYFDIEFYIN